jgi:hypothetical protein
MEEKLAKISAMIDEAIQVARLELIRNPSLSKNYSMAVKNLSDIKKNLTTGVIPTPSGGATLGLGRNIGEFDEGELYRLGNKIDHYYRDELNQF